MPKRAQELKDLQIRRLSQPGRHAVGGTPPGLSVSVSENGAKSWILRTTIDGKRRHIGLGSYPDVSLAEARIAALEMKRQIRDGIDPVEERRNARMDAMAEQTRNIAFEEAFERFFSERIQNAHKNEKHIRQWRSTISTYALPTIGKKLVDDISLRDIETILRPIWLKKTETASRLRGRLEAVFDWAKVKGYCEGENPAAWKGNLEQIFPAPNKAKQTTKRPAIALDEIAAWFTALRNSKGMAPRALEFLTLTAARSGEVRGAKWSEIDLSKALWTVPASRMKSNKEHRVPLSSEAIQLLEQLPRFVECPYVFPSPRNGEMSDMTLSAVMRRIQAKEEKQGRKGFLDPSSSRPAVPHGLRSSFRDWAAERTTYPREMAEHALSHNVGSAVERAYQRSDLLEKRRNMMEAWAEFLQNPPAPIGLGVGHYPAPGLDQA